MFFNVYNIGDSECDSFRRVGHEPLPKNRRTRNHADCFLDMVYAGLLIGSFGFLLLSSVHCNVTRVGLRDSYTKQLFNHIFVDYQKAVRPVTNDSQPVTITLQLWLKQVLKVDERDQILTIYCWLEMYWKDEYLAWDPLRYGGLDVIHVPSHMIWKPDIMVYNNANMNVEDNELETNAVIHNDGRVMLFRSLITDITCNLDLTYFPFDQQVCYMMFASWSMDGSKVLLEASNRSDNLDLYIDNTEWTLTDFSYKRDLKYYACCVHAFPDLSYFLVLKRSPSYYIFSLVIPSGFITIVTIIGFFTPHSSTGENTEKVSLGVTALLSMAIIMMMVSDEMPATTEVIPLIGKYYIGLIFIIFTAAFTTTLTLSFQMRGNSGRMINPITKRFFFITLAQNPYISWIFSVQLPPDIGESAKDVELIKQKEQTFLFDSEGANIDKKSRRLSNGYVGGDKNEVGGDATRRNSMIDVTLLRVDNGAAILKKQDTAKGDKSTPSIMPDYVLDQVRSCLEAIDDSMDTERIKARIRFEWQQVTRMIDRLIMIVFIVVTTVFATVMLNSHGEKIVLTEEVMNRVKH